MDDCVIVQVDKTVVKITGLEVKGLNIGKLEAVLAHRLKNVARIIGVTGHSLEMDVYGVEEEDIARDADGLIDAIALADGITLTDLAEISSVQKIRTVDIDAIPAYDPRGCIMERWLEDD